MPEDNPARGAHSRWRSALAVLLLIAAVTLFAPIALVAVVFNALAMTAICVGRLIAAISSRLAGNAIDRDELPRFDGFVSIQVPICNEPPALVKRTLDSLARLDHDAFEVIVLDNNTKDPEIWQPVAEHCRRLGPRFRFHHEEELAGFKAGALEMCIAMRDPRTEWYLVIDADYVVRADLLRLAAQRLASDEERVDFVQFPQAYRNEDLCPGLALEYRAFFDSIMETADRHGCALPTGTLCLVRRRSLEEIGGWSARSLTEDAELGATMVAAGRRGAFVNAVTGRGLMPDRVRSLKKQRRRWVVGNAQTLAGLPLQEVEGQRRRALLLLQLTAWFNFLLVPALVLVSIAILGYRDEPLLMIAAAVATGSIALELLLELVFMLMAPGPAQPLIRLRIAFEAMLGRRALVREAATGWFAGLLGTDLGFERTNKFGRKGSRGDLKAPTITLVAIAALTALAFSRGDTVVAAGLLLLALGPLGVFFLDESFRDDRRGPAAGTWSARIERLVATMTRRTRRVR